MRNWVVAWAACSIWVSAQEAAPLPQTNRVGKSSFVLTESGSKNLRLMARATEGAAAGWIHWRFAVEDSKGKRLEFDSGARNFDGSRFAAGPLKITTFPNEILSVGFVSEPRAGEVMKLNVNQRAAEFGLKDVFLVGSGNYVVRGDGELAHVEREGEGVRILAEKPMVAVLCRPVAEIERMDARVRERSKARDGGKIFQQRGRASEQALENGNVLRYAAVDWLQTTNRIEVEVVIRHRPVEFLVDFDKEKAGP